MKLLFDHHLSPALAVYFQSDFPGSQHVYPLGLDAVDDVAIWNFAKESNYVIVTKDSDYQELGMRFGFPPYVVLIRRGNCPTAIIREIIEAHTTNINEFALTDKSGVLILF